jgi:hypothetical protein
MKCQRAHVVGNGPSHVDFAKINETDYVVGCNLPVVQCDVTAVIDLRFTYTVYNKKIKIPCPAVVTQKVKLHLLKNPQTKMGGIVPIDTFAKYDQYNASSLSSGHHAVLWLIKQGYNEIHVWGCDSIATRSLESTTDSLIPISIKSSKQHCLAHTEKWISMWKKIVSNHPAANIIFHNLPNGKFS